MFLTIINSDNPVNTDNLFMYAQEKSIQNFCKKDYVPEVYAKQLKRLGDDTYIIREEYSYLLKDNVRAAVWGQLYKDQEISFRSTKILRKTLVCTHCKGLRVCTHEMYDTCLICRNIFIKTHDDYINTVYRSHGCVKCLATGSALIQIGEYYDLP
jgi:hypothetical protein